MKATIDIPDDLYRRVKARSAMLGRTVREVSIELYQRWLGEAPGTATSVSTAQWLDEWVALGRSIGGQNAEGPTASEIIASDRNRLERT
jgi:hypothetical protein